METLGEKNKPTKIYLLVDGKNGSDRDEAVNVGGTVQRIKAHDVFSLSDQSQSHRQRQFETTTTLRTVQQAEAHPLIRLHDDGLLILL